MKDLWGDMVERAYKLLRFHEPPEGYYVAFSGGKDSVVLLDVVKRSGVKYDAHYNLTTCDPPELVQFIRRQHPDVQIGRPKETMWQLVARNGLPTRIRRWCCCELKERGGAGRFVVTGIRTAESKSRAKRRQVHVCFKDKSKVYVHPLKDWSDDDIWRYIRENDVPYCSLYDEGFKRLGCVVCPFERKTARSMQRWPKLWAAMKRAARRYYDSRTVGHWNRPDGTTITFDSFWRRWLARDGPIGAGSDDMPQLFHGGASDLSAVREVDGR